MAEQTAFLRSSVPVEPGKYPVVLSPEAAGVFAHESFGHKSESDFMLSDEAMRDEWQLGKTVGLAHPVHCRVRLRARLRLCAL